MPFFFDRTLQFLLAVVLIFPLLFLFAALEFSVVAGELPLVADGLPFVLSHNRNH
jgi:hypothetical protein